MDTQEPTTALAPFRQIEVGIERLKGFSALRIDGIKDGPGLKAVHAARMEVKSVRVTIEKVRKDAKSALLEAGRAIDGEAARLTALVSPIEAGLQAQEDAIEGEKEAIRAAAEEAKRARVQVRLDAFAAIQMVPPVGIGEYLDVDYQAAFAVAKLERARLDEIAAAEAKRIADEQEAMRRERAELDRLRAEQDATRRAQEAQAQALREQEERIRQQEAAARRAEELAEAQRVAAEKAARDTESRLKRQQEAREQAAALAAQAEADRKAMEAKMKAEAEVKALADMPWKQKILAISAQVDAIVIPDGHQVMASVAKILTKASLDVRKLANGAL